MKPITSQLRSTYDAVTGVVKWKEPRAKARDLLIDHYAAQFNNRQSEGEQAQWITNQEPYAN